MCGIVGIWGNKTLETNNIIKMNLSQSHRGPDDKGIFESKRDQISLGMTRLSIIDLQYGKQPLSIDGGKFTIVFNGEIFNANELRNNLISRGEQFFSSNSDTELLVRLYKNYGTNCLKMLNGMFAFSIFDKKNQNLFLARDRFGIKPLYYFNKNDNFIFSSEIRGILNVIDRPDINHQSLYDYSSLKYIPFANTIYKNITKLLPGHYIKIDLRKNKLQIRKWWKLKFNINNKIKEKDWTEIIRNKIREAVSRWSISDVNYAFSLSGGLDSSSLVATSAENNKNIKTYSLVFKEKAYENWNELNYVKDMNNKYSLKSKELYVKSKDLIEDFHNMMVYAEEPYGAGLPRYLLFKEISNYEKVVITGEGGDEIFGNYNRAFNLLSKINMDYEKSKKTNMLSFEKYYHDKIYKFSNNDKIKYLSLGKNMRSTSHALFNIFYKDGNIDVFNKVANLEILTQLPDEYLNITDKYSMAHSLEARTPFLDHELVQLMFTVPTSLKFSKTDYKKLLRKSMGDLIPSSILENHNKKGFSLPISIWMRSSLKDQIMHYLGKKNLSSVGYVNSKFFDDFVKPFFNGSNKNIETIWGLFTFHYWYSEIYKK